VPGLHRARKRCHGHHQVGIMRSSPNSSMCVCVCVCVCSSSGCVGAHVHACAWTVRAVGGGLHIHIRLSLCALGATGSERHARDGGGPTAARGAVCLQGCLLGARYCSNALPIVAPTAKHAAAVSAQARLMRSLRRMAPLCSPAMPSTAAASHSSSLSIVMGAS
jgi:hypothetical protein